MRIANVITRLNIGGASPMALALTTGLKGRGHETLLVVGTPEPGEGTLEDEARAAGAEVVRIPMLRRNPHPVRDVMAFRGMVKVFRSWRPDIVATHMSKAGALGRLAGRMTGIPVVHTYHGKGFQVFNGRVKAWSALCAEKVLVRFAAGTIVVSDVQRREFEQIGLGSPPPQRVIRYGLRLDPFLRSGSLRGVLRGELGVAADVPLVGVIGRLVEIKGQDVFLKAAARIAVDHPLARFVIVGDGTSRAYLESLTSTLGIASRVQFLGWRRDIASVLAGLDIVVLPTVLDFEGVPVAVIEALAAARPVVATNVGGVSEAIEHEMSGLLVPPRNVEALASAIARLLLDSRAAHAMGERGREIAERLFTMDRYLQESEGFFREVLGSRPTGCR